MNGHDSLHVISLIVSLSEMTTYPLYLSENGGSRLNHEIICFKLSHITCDKNKSHIVSDYKDKGTYASINKVPGLLANIDPFRVFNTNTLANHMPQCALTHVVVRKHASVCATSVVTSARTYKY